MTRRALLVEDDGAIATVITAALEEDGFAVDRCDSIAGRDRLIAERSYDVMLTDVILGDGDGIETLADGAGDRAGHAGDYSLGAKYARHRNSSDRHRGLRILPKAVRSRRARPHDPPGRRFHGDPGASTPTSRRAPCR